MLYSISFAQEALIEPVTEQFKIYIVLLLRNSVCESLLVFPEPVHSHAHQVIHEII